MKTAAVITVVLLTMALRSSARTVKVEPGETVWFAKHQILNKEDFWCKANCKHPGVQNCPESQCSCIENDEGEKWCFDVKTLKKTFGPTASVDDLFEFRGSEVVLKDPLKYDPLCNEECKKGEEFCPKYCDKVIAE